MIKKNVKHGSYNVECVHFESAGEALDFIQNGREFTYTGRNRDDDWHGKVTLEGAIKLAEFGWAEGVQKFRDLCTTELQESEKESPTMFQLYHDVSGCMVDMDEYLRGSPECMLEFTAGKAYKLVKIIVHTGCLADIPPAVMYYRGFRLAELICQLEDQGYRTELLVWQSFSTSHTYKGFTVQIKKFQEALDVDSLMFWLAHPAALRHVGFEISDALGWYPHFGASYGRQFPVPDELCKECDLSFSQQTRAYTQNQARGEVDTILEPWLENHQVDRLIDKDVS